MAGHFLHFFNSNLLTPESFCYNQHEFRRTLLSLYVINLVTKSLGQENLNTNSVKHTRFVIELLFSQANFSCVDSLVAVGNYM